jgi:hypothetical protein
VLADLKPRPRDVELREHAKRQVVELDVGVETI